MDNASYQAALQVAQQAVIRLANWFAISFKHQSADLSPAVTQAMKILSWKDAEIRALRLIFDRINLSEIERKEPVHYSPAISVSDVNPSIPYPQVETPNLSQLKTEIKTALEKLSAEDWNNLSLLSLILEKYGSCLSFGDEDVALVDTVRLTGAVAAALAQSAGFEQVQNLSLVAGDLSGIQNFIYTISSEGALKSLRARSFYLELVTEEIVQQLLTALKLPRTNIIYAGGGNLFILAPQTIGEKIQIVAQKLNQWLNKEFQSKIFLALDCEPCLVEEVAGLAFKETWNNVIKKLNQQKTVKFKDQLSAILEPRHSYEPCRVCHRDDDQDLKPLNREEPDSSLACPICRTMFELGGNLFKVHSMVRSHEAEISGTEAEYIVSFEISNQSEDKVYYHLFQGRKPLVRDPEQVLLINNWSLEDHKFQSFQGRTTPMLLGNYFQQGEDGFMRAIEFAEVAQSSGCIARVGYLRMDVDRLGQIFASGLNDEQYSLPKIASLSRQMSYFFKVYLNTLAETRQLPETVQKLTDGDRPNLLFIYAGGDDLFVSGAWNEVVEFAFDVYQSFRAYTGYHPDITLSGGISIDDIKFPLYQSAESSGEAENLAKSNGRDSLGLFGKPFKWDEWLGATDTQKVKALINELDGKAKEHLDSNDQPEWLGILPFVRSLYAEKGNYSHSFIRNLLLTADLQEQAIKEKQEQIDKIRKNQFAIQDNPEVAKLECEREEIRYYLHLPKIAYTLACLPDQLRKPDPISKEDKFKPLRTSLKNPYNAPYFRAIATWIELLHRNYS